MRCVVEGEPPDDFIGEDASDDSDEEGHSGEVWKAPQGVVYRIVKGQLKRLDGGMRKYEEIAAKASAKLKVSR
jgi:ATP-binding cassette, subfamily F, member 3